MATFGCDMKRVKTRKPHDCLLCGRTIPSGTRALHIGGMWEGDWQNWYMCEFCNSHCADDLSEGVNGEEFGDWLRNQPFNECPECHGIDPETGKKDHCWPDWDWSEDLMSVEFQCEYCEHKWTQHIGFESRMAGEGK